MADQPLPLHRTLVIKRRVPSQNQFQYRQWKAYFKEKEAWYLLIRAQLAPRIAVAEPVRLRLVSHRNRVIDYANLVGGAKPIPDVLKMLGYLKDDSPRWFFCEYFQMPCARADERTELTMLPWSGESGEDAGV